MIKIIFLDIDGVLAIPSNNGGFWGLDLDRQLLLGEILDKTDAKIVLSSSWRKHSLEDTISYMISQGFKYPDKIIGITIRAYHYIEKGIHLSIPRGVEIKQWVDTNIHSNNVKDWNRKKLCVDWNYVILDDDCDMLLEHKDNFIRCNSIEGLTNEHVKKAIEILNKK